MQILKGRESQKGQAGGSQKSAVSNFPLTTPQTPDFEEAMEHFAPAQSLRLCETSACLHPENTGQSLLPSNAALLWQVSTDDTESGGTLTSLLGSPLLLEALQRDP